MKDNRKYTLTIETAEEDEMLDLEDIRAFERRMYTELDKMAFPLHASLERQD